MGALSEEIIAEKMRVIVALFACIIAVSMAVPDFTEDVEPQMQDMELLEVQNEAQATIAAMKKKGVTHADCKDLAKTSCEEVEREVSTDQSLLNKLKTGHHCMKLGVHSEKKALTHWSKENQGQHFLPDIRNPPPWQMWLDLRQQELPPRSCLLPSRREGRNPQAPAVRVPLHHEEGCDQDVEGRHQQEEEGQARQGLRQVQDDDLRPRWHQAHQQVLQRKAQDAQEQEAVQRDRTH